MKYTFYIIISLIISANLVSAQCFDPDTSIWKDTWTSCEQKENPNTSFDKSHWLQYDFGAIRRLSKTWVWNTNDPDKLDQGFKKVNIDYSSDGEEWINWGEMEFAKGTGHAIYGGFPGPDLMGIEAQYVLITLIENHGNTQCAGIAEIKFNLLPDQPEGEPSDDEEEEEDCLAIEEFFVEEVFQTEAIIVWEYEFEEEEEEEEEEDEEDEEIVFLFQYQEEGQDIEEIETTEFEVFLEDLLPDTYYEFRIGLECDEEIVWSEIGSFTTEPDDSFCHAVESLWVDYSESTEVLIAWEEAEYSEYYIVVFGELDEEEYDEIMTEESSILLEELEPGTEYEVYIIAICDDEEYESEALLFETPDGIVNNLYSITRNANSLNYKVVPNPNSGHFGIQINSHHPDEVTYTVRDLNGKILLLNHALINNGLNKIDIDIANLPDGMYVLNGKFKQKQQVIQERIIKINN